MSLLDQLDPLERALALKKFPAMTPWWRETFQKFYTSGKRQLVVRVGRRGGKSTSISRIAVLEGLYGQHSIPPGDVGTVAIISTRRDEAAGRLRAIEAILNALKVKHRRNGDTIELVTRPIQFRVFTGSIAGVSGFTCICLIGDEVAKWRDADTNSNPAKEVLASAYPTQAGHKNAKVFLLSSPFGKMDAHYEAFEKGDNEFQCVAAAATWVARPNLSREECWSLANGDEKIFRREYEAVPQNTATDAFDQHLIDRAFRAIGPYVGLGAPTMFTDSSAGRSDSWTWCVAKYVRPGVEEGDGWLYRDAYNADGTISAKRAYPVRDENGNRVPDPEAAAKKAAVQPLLFVNNLGALEGKFATEIDSDQVVDRLAWIAKRADIKKVHGDGYQAYFLATAFAKRKLAYITQNWTAESKLEAVTRLRQWLRDGSIIIENNEEGQKLKKELLNFEEKITPSGFVSFGARRGGHDDRVALLLNIAMADVDGALEGSPIKKFKHRIEYGPGDGSTTKWG